jgi:hypothetical protein
MAYKITLDFINRGSDHASEVGKGRYRKRDDQGNIIRELSNEDMPHVFRLKDYDGEVYFHGISNDSSSFSPLDGIGASYGCTMIEYKNAKDQWELL